MWLTGNDPDCGPYSARLISTLQKSGWTGNIAGETVMSFPPPRDVGLHLCGKSQKPPKRWSRFLEYLPLSHQDLSHSYATCDKFGANFDAKFLKRLCPRGSLRKSGNRIRVTAQLGERRNPLIPRSSANLSVPRGGARSARSDRGSEGSAEKGHLDRAGGI